MTTIIAGCIEKYLNMGLTDKNEIYSKVIDELGVPRPTVRRIARDMRSEMVRKVRILQSEIDIQKNV
jgi:hypothetical protein